VTGAPRAWLASANPHKLEELRRAIPGWELEAVEATAYPPETGATYVENAWAKARHGLAFAPRGAWVLGEDSGIEASALGGAPGLHSARWAADGTARLLDELEGVAEREARYVCALVALSSAGVEVAGEGVLEGTIADAPRGCEGFGYDPVFVPLGEEQTVAELGDAWKARHSHRARAALALTRRASAPGRAPGSRRTTRS
jgi:XTP/dITP diphosphohydrolase